MKKILICTLGFGLAAAFFASVADFAYPGESAAILAQLQGVGESAVSTHPLFNACASILGGGNLLAPIAGAIGCTMMFLIVAGLVYSSVNKDKFPLERERFALIAAAAATLVFALTPAVRSSSTHLEPRLFDCVWALVGFAMFLPFHRFKLPHWSIVLALGVWSGVGAVEGALISCCVPFYALLILFPAVKSRHRRQVIPSAAYLASAFFSLLIALWIFGISPFDWLRDSRREFLGWMQQPGWVMVFVFAVLPLLVAVLAVRRSFKGEIGMSQWMTHVGLSILNILAVATALSPSTLMRPYGVLPVFSSATAAIVSGYLLAYWWMHRRVVVAIVTGGVLAFVLAVTLLWNLFTFDGESGAFADRIAERVIAELGERHWLITDGVLDNHLRLEAKKQGKTLHLISLNRDLDLNYLDELSELVEREGLGGAKNHMLKLSAKLGVLPFLNDWFACDASVKTTVAVWGAPDLWYAAGIKPVPELLFFGADEKRQPDWSAWKELDVLLKVPKGWGSYRDRGETDPVERLRQSLRRHVGLVANDRGVYLQDRGDSDAAWKMYELVLNEIDRDNICAIFNEVAMIGLKHPSALAKRRDLERMIKSAVDDKNRRYLLWRLGSYYGYIRDPAIFIQLGHGWARSGRPGDALAQIKRAIDIVPDNRRASLMNLLASLYASDNDREESRRLWDAALKQNANDHDALVGMMRLEMQEGNFDEARRYLELATRNAGNGRTSQVELAMLAMMKNDLAAARQYLQKLVDADANDQQSWSLLAAVIMQQADNAKTEAEKNRFAAELEKTIMPSLERAAAAGNDYYVNAVKGFVYLRQGENRRKEARDAFVAAAKARPDVASTRDLVMGMDISLGDKESAEAHARDALRRDRKQSMANYIMGSLALEKGNFADAEIYLRMAAEAAQPTPLSFNDLAEVLRRAKKYDEAEYYARKAVKVAPKLAAAWDTLGAVLLDAGKNLEEAEASVTRACELSKTAEGVETDVRMLITLSRIQLKRNDKPHARVSLRKVAARIDELSEYERKEFEVIRNGVK